MTLEIENANQKRIKMTKEPIEILEERLEKLEKYIRQNDIIYRRQIQQLKNEMIRIHSGLQNEITRIQNELSRALYRR